MACFRCNTTENLILSLKYRQRKFDLKASEKTPVFVTIRHPATVYENFIFTLKIRNLQKHAALLRFRLKEISENLVFP